MEELYFLDTDEDSHWYMIPADKREEWQEWCDSGGYDEFAEEFIEVPDFAKPLGGHPNRVEFYLNKPKNENNTREL